MLDEILESPAFWILTGVGVGAFSIMIITLNKMGNGALMPIWVKIATFIAIPVLAALFSGWASGN